MPKRCGILKSLNKFDAAFFGVSPKQASRMDPQLRMMLETTYEAIIDAGFCKCNYQFKKKLLAMSLT